MGNKGYKYHRISKGSNPTRADHWHTMYHRQQQRQSTKFLTWAEMVYSYHTEQKWYEWGVGPLITTMKLKRAENHKKSAKKQPLRRWSARVGSAVCVPSASPGMLQPLVPIWWVSWCQVSPTAASGARTQLLGHSWRGSKTLRGAAKPAERRKTCVCILYPSIFHPALGRISHKCQAN